MRSVEDAYMGVLDPITKVRARPAAGEKGGALDKPATPRGNCAACSARPRAWPLEAGACLAHAALNQQAKQQIAAGSAARLAAPSHCAWRPAPHQAIVFAFDETFLGTVSTNGGTYQPLPSSLPPPPLPPVPALATCVIPLGRRALLCTLDRMEMVSFAASNYTWDSARRVTAASFSWNITVGTLAVAYEDPAQANETVGAPGGVEVVFNTGTATCTAMVRNSAKRGECAGAAAVWVRGMPGCRGRPGQRCAIEAGALLHARIA